MDTGKLKETITNILRNKNTLTILLVFAGIIGLYVVYNWRVNDAISTVQIPYAKKELNSRTKITDEMIGYTPVPKSLLSSANNLINNAAQVLNKYVNNGYTIPQYSLFYRESILSTTATPESQFSNLPDNYTAFQLTVDFDKTYGNSIYPGNYIDLYIKLKTSDDKILFGRLIKGIQVLSVVDGDGNNVFDSTSEIPSPRYMQFGVPNDLFDLLEKAQILGADIMPIPRNASYSLEDRNAEIDSVYIQNYILARAVNFNN